ncbi:uncharacterized protein LOC133032327 [Cannabis sativa]|uniref:uncharacterized protein LOC133032327 n=1 Tax=Cannabis sativa TaxID=3483 RepID=UPI0029CA88E4|nr:uncharacterized protein LOC133032327 [Cannabis sativa]
MEHHKVLWWSILSNALPVRSVIKKRFHIKDASCFLCGMGEETLEQLFLSCDVALHVWRASPWGIYPVCDTGIRMWDWIKFIWNLKHREIDTHEVFLYALIVVDSLWRTQNEKVYNNRHVDMNKCIDNICNSFADLHASLFASPALCWKDVWSPPPMDWIKLNCDVKVELQSMCIAVVARDYLSRVVGAHTSLLDFSDALCGEATTCCLAVSVAMDLGYKFVIVESDSRVVINALNGMDSQWTLENYVSFCNSYSSRFSSYKMTGNKTQHVEATLASIHTRNLWPEIELLVPLSPPF